MNLSISARHMELTDGLRSHVEERCAKLTRLLDDQSRIHVTLSVERNLQIADIIAKGPRTLFQAQERSDDMYLSIDRATTKVERQLRRHRDKRKEQKARAPKVTAPENLAPEPTVAEGLLETLGAVEETREISVQRLPEHEAIRLMEDHEEPLWAFRDPEDGRLRILARCGDEKLRRYDLIDNP
ncbi:MAG: ribosome-associated translation inhibitor RaiA [Nitrospirae bacterium]|nr:MAG: ribosome-associated translation inhibitor RaiA [Nitrospirota bacterium]